MINHFASHASLSAAGLVLVQGCAVVAALGLQQGVGLELRVGTSIETATANSIVPSASRGP